MTLLSRGIKSGGTGQGSYLDLAIAKEEGKKAQKEASLEAYSSQLEGIKSGGMYLGETSRTVLSEYGKAFESAMDAYSADPSQENKEKLNQIKTQAIDFQNMAIAARQNSLNQYNAVRQDPDSYDMTAEEALAKFNEVENATGMGARFDMNSMQMFIGDDETGEQFLGNAAYYNGQRPLFFAKKPDISDVKSPGDWGRENEEKFGAMLDTEEGVEKARDAFVQTARFNDSAWRDTAVLNYLIDEKGISEDDPHLARRIQELRNDPEELVSAINYEADKEIEAMRAHRGAKQAQAARETMAKNYRGDRKSRGERSAPQKRTLTEADESSEMYTDEFAGVESVRMLNAPITAKTGKGGVAGLSEYGDVINGLDVDALGRIVIQVDKVVPDPNDEEQETIESQFHVLEEGQLYDNLRARLKKEGTFATMQRESMARMEEHEDAVNNARMAKAYANSEAETPKQFEVDPLMDAKIRQATGQPDKLVAAQNEKRQEELGKIQDQFSAGAPQNNVIVSPVQGANGAFVARTNRRLIDRLEDMGLTASEIQDGLSYMRKEGKTIELSWLRNTVQNPGRFLWAGNEYEIPGLPGDDMADAAQEFIGHLMDSNPIYAEKFGTGPKPMTSADEAKLKSQELFGRDFSKDSPEVETIFGEEGYSGDGTLVNVPSGSVKSGVTIGGLDLGKEAGNIKEKLEILSEFIPEEEMKTLESMQGLTGQEADKALNDSLATGKLNPKSWGFNDDTFKEIQGKFLGRNTMPTIERKMSKFGVTKEQIQELPPEVRSAIVSMEFVTPGKRGLSLIAKAMKSGKKEDWLAAADEYESYYGNEEQVNKKLKSKRILPGNVKRAKKAAELIRSVYS